MSEKEIAEFLSHLACSRHVSAATQNQALNAIVFLYKHVINKEIGGFSRFSRAKTTSRVPTVFSPQEIANIFSQFEDAESQGQTWLMVNLIYGGGLRVNECLQLRTKDIDLAKARLIIRDAKHSKDRLTNEADWPVDTTLAIRRFSAHSNRQKKKPVLIRLPVATTCGTHLPHTCCLTATMFELCRSCWVTRALRQRWSIYKSPRTFAE